MNDLDPLYRLERTNLHARREYRTKGDLRILAVDVLANFAKALRDLPRELETPGPSELIAQYNLGSLAQIQYGMPDRGTALCKKAIDVCLQLGRESGTPRWMGEMFQPYINLGRIASAQGETERALKIFRQVFRFITCGENVQIHGCLLESAVLAPPPSQRARTEPLFEIYLQDSLKALAWAGHSEAILAFVDQVEQSPGFDTPHFRRIIAEARARALLDLGRYGEAAGSMEMLSSWAGSDLLPQPAVCILLAEIHLQAGDRERSFQIMKWVEGFYPQLCAPDVPLSERRKFRYLAGFQYFRLGDYSTAAARIEEALSMNRELGDDPGILKCGILALRCARLLGEHTETHRDALHRDAQHSLYRQEQALAFYELAQSAQSATLFKTCAAILRPLDTVDSRYLLALLPQTETDTQMLSTCSEMNELFKVLSMAGDAAPLLPAL